MYSMGCCTLKYSKHTYINICSQIETNFVQFLFNIRNEKLIRNFSLEIL